MIYKQDTVSAATSREFVEYIIVLISESILQYIQTWQKSNNAIAVVCLAAYIQ